MRVSNPCAQVLQTLGSGGERFVAFAETEADLLRAERGIAVEGRTGHARDADLAHEKARELDIISEAEATDVGHDVVRAVGREDTEARIFERRQKRVAPRAILILKVLIITLRQTQRVSSGSLQGSRRADR